MTHARLIAIQNQCDLTRMRKDRFTICNDAAELQVPQEEIWGRERRKVLLLLLLLITELLLYLLPYQSKKLMLPPPLIGHNIGDPYTSTQQEACGGY
jgi:hypothetical protein